MSEELKPCPFCGTPAVVHITEYDRGSETYTIDCSHMNCGGSPGVYDSSEEAVNQWNSRPLEDALRAELAEARAEIERLREATRPIPVSERLPENEAPVLVIYRSFVDYLGIDFYHQGKWQEDYIDNVVYWMPLPPPPPSAPE